MWEPLAGYRGRHRRRRSEGDRRVGIDIGINGGSRRVSGGQEGVDVDGGPESGRGVQNEGGLLGAVRSMCSCIDGNGNNAVMHDGDAYNAKEKEKDEALLQAREPVPAGRGVGPPRLAKLPVLTATTRELPQADELPEPSSPRSPVVRNNSGRSFDSGGGGSGRFDGGGSSGGVGGGNIQPTAVFTASALDEGGGTGGFQGGSQQPPRWQC